jgi:hypothetical protein
MNSKFVFDLGSIDLSDGRAGLAAVAGDDTPLPLELAAWAPEIAGLLGFPAFTVLDMRGAIRRGELRPERHGNRILVTRRQLREWRDRCRVPAPPPASGTTREEINGASLITAKSIASKVAALEIAVRLKNGSRRT